MEELNHQNAFKVQKISTNWLLNFFNHTWYPRYTIPQMSCIEKEVLKNNVLIKVIVIQRFVCSAVAIYPGGAIPHLTLGRESISGIYKYN